MLKSNVKWPPSRRFKSRTEWEPIGFFSEALCNATEFDLKLGFFSSSAINVLCYGFSAFLYSGGRMRMIINNILSNFDINAIIVGESSFKIPDFDLQDIEHLSKILSKRNKHFFECLSWLIRNNRIDIKIVRPKDGIGIAHSKCGLFSDGVNKVAFDGSCNFSRTALLENIESITAFCDWDGQSDVYKIQDIAYDFEKTFSGKDSNVSYLTSDGIKTSIVDNFANKELNELLEDEAKLIDDSLENELTENAKYYIAKSKIKVSSIINSIKEKENVKITSENEPRFPYGEPRTYQKEAFYAWIKNKQRGLFAMATGTGKTITALNCLLEIYKGALYYKALILVPTITLVEQWKEECEKFNFSHIYLVSSKNKEWRKEISFLHLLEDMDPTMEKNSYIIIATYASFSRENIFKELISFPKKKLLLIADEAHNMGSNSILNKLNAIHYLRRIGLSATPDRQYDVEGNSAIRSFFGAERQYTFEFSMKEAISKGFLCRYYYYPHLVHLTNEEMGEYIEISKKLARMFNFQTGTFGKNNDILTALLLKRKRIIHKAANKIKVFQDIIQARYEEKHNLKYTLVYVPEGNATDSSTADFFDANHNGDDYTSHLIDTYTEIIKNVDSNTTVFRFTADTNDRDRILRQFASGELEVLTSMKCLDEGVDVPRSEMAIFCSSTGNPRQFIQRRGRILRKHPDKQFAIIHDLVVAPRIDISSVSYKMERALLGGELKRVNNFALLSENADATLTELDNILDYYRLSIF